MQQYHDLLFKVLSTGRFTEDRTGVGTYSLFGERMVFDLQDGFPLVTTKRLYTKAIVEELLWFISGSTNERDLSDKGVKIWREWADPETGELGPVYGAQWRSWRGVSADGRLVTIDQLAQVMHSLKHNPHSRRHVVSAWNVAQVPDMALPPCHLLFQFHVEDRGADGKFLSCQLYQRSADMFLGVPFNIASYALLVHLMADILGYGVGTFTHVLGDTHIYQNHTEQVRLQLDRVIRPLPQLELLTTGNTLKSVAADQIVFNDYDPHPAIKAEVAV